jgi:chemotaxis protein methyltransferase CheR
LLLSFGLHSFSELYYQASTDRSGELEKKIVDAVSTQETLFFRDQSPFELFKYKILPDLIDAKSKRDAAGRIPIRIWSAGCSTGQEVYSIGICLLEMLARREDYDISILGTDISEEALAQASYGAYSRFEIERGLPRDKLQRYFTPVSGGWRIKDEVRSLAMFKKQNLMEPFSGLGRFDAVFCRNVAIYFAHGDKVKLYEKIARALQPNGYLIVGGSESLSGVAPQFETRRYLKGVSYVRRDRKEQAAAKPPAEKHSKPSSPPQVNSRRSVAAAAGKPQPQGQAAPGPAGRPGPEQPRPAEEPIPAEEESSGNEAHGSLQEAKAKGREEQREPSWRSKGQARPEQALLDKLGSRGDRQSEGGLLSSGRAKLRPGQGRSLLARIKPGEGEPKE